jgi:hypothetical protein
VASDVFFGLLEKNDIGDVDEQMHERVHVTFPVYLQSLYDEVFDVFKELFQIGLSKIINIKRIVAVNLDVIIFEYRKSLQPFFLNLEKVAQIGMHFFLLFIFLWEGNLDLAYI